MALTSRIKTVCLAATVLTCLTSMGLAQDLTIGVQRLPKTLDPALENSNVNLRVMYNVFETLIKTDYRNGGKLLPGLATSWKVISPREIEFKLREGVKFHNGDTLDAKDVVATFAPIRIGALDSKDAPSVETRQFMNNLDHVEVVDPMTVRIHMKTDDALIVQRFAAYPSQIVSETILDEEKYEDYGKKPAGTGPYEVTEFVTGEKIEIHAFDGYWGDVKAAAENVTFAPVPEITTRIAGLQSGQFDIITEVGPDAIAQIENGEKTVVVGGPVENVRGLIFRSTNPVMQDPRVRQALNLAVDRELIVKTLYEGRTEVPHGWQMDIFGDMYLEDRGAPEYNPEKAKQLLKEAGYNGEEIFYPTQHYYTLQAETSQILQSMWAAVGLNVKVKIFDGWDQINAGKQVPDMFDGSFTAYYPDPMGQFWRRFGPNAGWYRDGMYTYGDKMLELGNVLATSIDTKERRKVFAEMLDMFDKDPNGLLLHVMTQIYGVREDRLTFSPMPSEYMDLTEAGVTFVK